MNDITILAISLIGAFVSSAAILIWLEKEEKKNQR
jgi:hypothetical protein